MSLPAELSKDDVDAIKRAYQVGLAAPAVPQKGAPPRPGSAGMGGGVPRNDQRASAITGFSDAIVNALAAKKLEEAKKTKKELMEERMKQNIGGKEKSARGLALQRAASKKLVDMIHDEEEDLKHKTLSKWRKLRKRLRTEYEWFSNVVAYGAYKFSKPIVESEDFELLIILIIFVNCISLALFNPTEPPDSEWNSTLDTLELSLNVIFTVELLLRCMYLGAGNYISNPWNKFDFALVLAGYSGLMAPSGSEENTGGGLRALRALRALRPLRTITRFESLRSVVVCFVEAVPLLVSVVALVFFFTFLFAIAGQQLFSEAYHKKCMHPITGVPEYDIDEFGCNPHKKKGGLGRFCPATDDFGDPLVCGHVDNGRGDSLAGYDNVGLAMLTVFQCTTQAGWAQAMYRIMDNGAEMAIPYFILLIFFGPYFVVNLFLAVLKTKFGKAQSLFQSKIVKKDKKKNTLAAAGSWVGAMIAAYVERRRLAAEHREEMLAQQLLESDGGWNWRTEMKRRYAVLKEICYEIQDHKYFNNFFLGLIYINTIMMAVEYHGMSQKMIFVLMIANFVFTFLFTMEVTIKLIGLGTWEFFQDNFNIFDFIIVAFALIEVVAIGGSSISSMRSLKSLRSLKVLKALRVFRVFKMFRYLASLRIIGEVILSSLSSFMSIAVLLFLFLLVFAIVGLHVFGGLKDPASFTYGVDDPQFGGRASFDSFYQSVLLTFQVLTLEDWEFVMFKTIDYAGWGAAAWFVIWVIVGKYTFLTLFLAVTMEAFESKYDAQASSEARLVARLQKKKRERKKNRFAKMKRKKKEKKKAERRERKAAEKAAAAGNISGEEAKTVHAAWEGSAAEQEERTGKTSKTTEVVAMNENGNKDRRTEGESEKAPLLNAPRRASDDVDVESMGDSDATSVHSMTSSVGTYTMDQVLENAEEERGGLAASDKTVKNNIVKPPPPPPLEGGGAGPGPVTESFVALRSLFGVVPEDRAEIVVYDASAHRPPSRPTSGRIWGPGPVTEGVENTPSRPGTRGSMPGLSSTAGRSSVGTSKPLPPWERAALIAAEQLEAKAQEERAKQEEIRAVVQAAVEQDEREKMEAEELAVATDAPPRVPRSARVSRSGIPMGPMGRGSDHSQGRRSARPSHSGSGGRMSVAGQQVTRGGLVDFDEEEGDEAKRKPTVFELIGQGVGSKPASRSASRPASRASGRRSARQSRAPRSSFQGAISYFRGSTVAPEPEPGMTAVVPGGEGQGSGRSSRRTPRFSRQELRRHAEAEQMQRIVDGALVDQMDEIEYQKVQAARSARNSTVETRRSVRNSVKGARVSAATGAPEEVITAEDERLIYNSFVKGREVTPDMVKKAAATEEPEKQRNVTMVSTFKQDDDASETETDATSDTSSTYSTSNGSSGSGLSSGAMTPSSWGGNSGLTSGTMTPNMGGRFEGLESVVGSRQSSFTAVKGLITSHRSRDLDLADTSCWCIPGHHPLREDLYDIISHWTFDNFMFLLIFISCVVMAMEKPDMDPDLEAKLAIVDYVLAACFTLEAALKIITFSFRRYIHTRTNQLDFFIVCTTLLEMSLTAVGGLQAVRSLRILRAIRPLRALTKSSGMRLVLKSVALSIGAMVNVSMVMLMFFIIFGILGVQVFMGRFYRCNDPSVELREQCVGTYYDISSGRDTERIWSNADLNYDNLYNGLVSLFVVSTLDGYGQVMFDALDVVGIDKQPKMDNNRGAFLYYMAFIVLVAFSLLNLYVGVIFYQFSRIRMLSQTSSMDLTEEQKEWAEMCKAVLKMKPQRKVPKPKDAFRKIPFAIISHRYFDPFIMGCIVMNVMVMAARWYDEPDSWIKIQDDINLAFTMVFIAEAALKIVAMGFKEYWRNSWNKFDFIIVVGSILDLTASFLSAAFVRLIRLFRISRMFRLIKSLKGVKKLFDTLLVSLPAFWNVGALVLLIFFVYSYIGVILFGTVIRGDCLNEHANFENFQNAMLTLFRVSTNDEWVCIMHDTNVKPPNCSGKNCGSWISYPYFISFVIIVSMIMLNLFTAVIIENFENMQDHEEWKLSPNILEEYVDYFQEFDDGTGTISPADMELLIRRIKVPLGVGNKASRVFVVHFIKSLNLPLTLEGRVPFRRTAFELVRRVSECDMPPGEMRDRIEYSIRKAFPDIWEPIPDELSWAALMCVIRVQRHWRTLSANRKKRAEEAARKTVPKGALGMVQRGISSLVHVGRRTSSTAIGWRTSSTEPKPSHARLNKSLGSFNGRWGDDAISGRGRKAVPDDAGFVTPTKGVSGRYSPDIPLYGRRNARELVVRGKYDTELTHYRPARHSLAVTKAREAALPGAEEEETLVRRRSLDSMTWSRVRDSLPAFMRSRSFTDLRKVPRSTIRSKHSPERSSLGAMLASGMAALSSRMSSRRNSNLNSAANSLNGSRRGSLDNSTMPFMKALNATSNSKPGSLNNSRRGSLDGLAKPMPVGILSTSKAPSRYGSANSSRRGSFDAAMAGKNTSVPTRERGLSLVDEDKPSSTSAGVGAMGAAAVDIESSALFASSSSPVGTEGKSEKVT